MTTFQSQLEAIGTALLLIPKLPEGTVWALTATNDDDARSPTVFNIYFRDDPEAETLVTLLKLGEPVDVDQDEEFASWRRGTLFISLIHHPETHHE
jgi:hypothetical protein